MQKLYPSDGELDGFWCLFLLLNEFLLTKWLVIHQLVLPSFEAHVAVLVRDHQVRAVKRHRHVWCVFKWCLYYLLTHLRLLVQKLNKLQTHVVLNIVHSSANYHLSITLDFLNCLLKHLLLNKVDGISWSPANINATSVIRNHIKHLLRNCSDYVICNKASLVLFR